MSCMRCVLSLAAILIRVCVAKLFHRHTLATGKAAWDKGCAAHNRDLWFGTCRFWAAKLSRVNLAELFLRHTLATCKAPWGHGFAAHNRALRFCTCRFWAAKLSRVNLAELFLRHTLPRSRFRLAVVELAAYVSLWVWDCILTLRVDEVRVGYNNVSQLTPQVLAEPRHPYARTQVLL